MAIDLRNWLRADDGTAVNAATVDVFASLTTGVATTGVAATTSTESAQGRWHVTGLDADTIWDVRLTSGAQVRWHKGGASPQFFDVHVMGHVFLDNGVVGAPSLTFRNDPNSGFYRPGADNVALALNGALWHNWNLGAYYINETANANMTVGLTINQGDNDNEIFALKSSDVIHGGVGGMETDTFLSLIKLDGAGGGVNLRCLADGNMPVGVLSALRLSGYLATNAMTTKTTAGRGIIDLYATQITGGAEQNIIADGNLVSIRGYTGGASTTRFIFDVEGSAHANVEWTTYDEHDDLALLNQLDAAMTADPVKTEFGRFLGDYRQRLQEAKIVTFYDDGPRAMVNFTRLAMLTVGALRQVGDRLTLIESRVKLLPQPN